ncbi:hypothetical protein [Nocardia asteroides]|uniref:hypothetical protein n=1 Tax=Nocardia asteroides TaxID=1824 RepID=UPI001E4032D9|nr:hypothetical protein [Nocardia asteroides]UGT59856.1 hypothetical protein LTT61_21865 [Nocardia asteroides]
MSITVQNVKVLWAKAYNQCAFPSCQQELTLESVDATTGAVRTTPVGEQAHIRSYKPDGPRYDSSYPAEKLHSYENLILLCPTHHQRVDANGGAEFTVDDLLEMRKTHEAQAKRCDEIDRTIQKYMAQQYGADNKVLFEQVDLNGPSVDSLFVDVPFACRLDANVAELMQCIAETYPGDIAFGDDADGHIVTGAAQALLHPEWRGNALLVGGPGQGKSTLLQYVCQFHRARLLARQEYTGEDQKLGQLTTVYRVPIRLDLRKYAIWASRHRRNPSTKGSKNKGGRAKTKTLRWPTIEEYMVVEVSRNSGGRAFSVEDLGLLISTRPALVAFDGLDEVANLMYREEVSSQIVDTQRRLAVDAADLHVLVATRPGGATSALWSSPDFPRLNLQKLTHGLRVQYLQRWAKVAKLSIEAANKLQRTFMENQNVPHIRELASYPMQLAILLHLLHRRQLLPQRRTELYGEYLKTFLDREQGEEKEPLLAEERQVIEDIHSYIGWYIQTQAEEGKSSGSIKRADLKALLRKHLDGRDDGQKLAEDLFSAFTTRVLCLVERDPGYFQFEVQSLREYFAAIYIFDEVDRNLRDDCLVALLKRPYWSNVCRFLVGKYSKGEIRGMRSVLQDLSKDKNLGLHPLLRSTAALFLNDRSYEGQKDEPIQEIVDFILCGPGVILAEDGLLDVAGSGLHLSERAGRIQAVRHLKARLEAEAEPQTRAAAAASLRRHAEGDDLASWWWERFNSTWRWLQTASHLYVLGGLLPDAEARLAQLLATSDSGEDWAAQLLVAGGFDGSSDDVLRIVMRDVNDGAVEVLKLVDRSTPAGRILTGAKMATLRRPGGGGAAATRTRFRGKGEALVLSSVTDVTAALRDWSPVTATDSEWLQQLIRIADVWSDGWILRQAIAAMPEGTSLSTMALAIDSRHPELQVALNTEAEARDHRGDHEWWRQQLLAAVDDFAVRHWVFSLLTCAHSSVVIALATDLSEVVDRIAAKYYTAIWTAVHASCQVLVGRKLMLHEALRMNRVTFSAKTLWLLYAASTEESAEQISKRLAHSFEALLEADVGDVREFISIVGNMKLLKFEVFRKHRTSLPIAGWASSVKIGVLSRNVADEVLRRPQEWPSDLVQRAVEVIEDRVLAELTPIAQVAEADNWFGN